jgi:hypothetical protein
VPARVPGWKDAWSGSCSERDRQHRPGDLHHRREAMELVVEATALGALHQQLEVAADVVSRLLTIRAVLVRALDRAIAGGAERERLERRRAVERGGHLDDIPAIDVLVEQRLVLVGRRDRILARELLAVLHRHELPGADDRRRPEHAGDDPRPLLALEVGVERDRLLPVVRVLAGAALEAGAADHLRGFPLHGATAIDAAHVAVGVHRRGFDEMQIRRHHRIGELGVAQDRARQPTERQLRLAIERLHALVEQVAHGASPNASEAVGPSSKSGCNLDVALRSALARSRLRIA